jgi:hypothetical protein
MNLFKSTLLAFFTVTILSTSGPAKAVVGLISGTVPLAISGLVMGAGGLAATEIYAKQQNVFLAMAGALTSAVGVILLDDGQNFHFHKVSQTEGNKIGLTSAEVASFNSEIDQVNALASHVGSELSGLTNPTVNDSVAIWASVKDAISPETFTAMQKISAQL